MVAVDEEACSPPVGRRDVHIAITPHPTREFDKRSELTPPNDIRTVVDEGCVGPVRSDKLLLVLLVLPRPQLRLGRGEVEEGASRNIYGLNIVQTCEAGDFSVRQG